MPAAVSEVWYHPNANNYWHIMGGGIAYEIVPRGGESVANIINGLIQSGSVDRRPGAPNQFIGSPVVRAMLGMTMVGQTIT
jgi:hypothetical protein